MRVLTPPIYHPQNFGAGNYKNGNPFIYLMDSAGYDEGSLSWGIGGITD